MGHWGGKTEKKYMPTRAHWRTRSKGRSRPRAASRTRRSRTRRSSSGSRRGRCVRQTSARYTTRGSPPFPANQCRGETKRGNDGTMFRSTPNIRGICTWRKVASKRSRARPARSRPKRHTRPKRRSRPKRHARHTRSRSRFGKSYDHDDDVDVSKIARAEQERRAAQGRLDELRRRAVRAREEAAEREIIARYASSSRGAT
jgi:hypothetical protein